jgi:hypothetical protein
MIEILDYAFPGTVFDPEIIQVLASAFDDAWEKIEKSGSRFARPGYSRAMREVIAKRIFEMAQQGVTNRRRSLKTQRVSFEPTTKTISAARHKGNRV